MSDDIVVQDEDVDNTAQRTSPSFRLPILDSALLLRDEMRAVRFALEYAKADLGLRDWGVRSTVIVFGSARTPSPEAAERRAGPPVAVALAQRQARTYEMARAFARQVSLEGGALAPDDDGQRDNVIATGGGPGIMEAANRGAADVGAPSIGFNIELPHEQEPNGYSTPTLTFQFHYFAMRKMHLAMRANALAVFPGGFGTLDELFEILALRQTGKCPPLPILLFGPDYWRRLIDFDLLVDEGMISPEDIKLIEFVDTAEAGWRRLVDRGLLRPRADGAAR